MEKAKPTPSQQEAAFVSRGQTRFQDRVQRGAFADREENTQNTDGAPLVTETDVPGVIKTLTCHAMGAFSPEREDVSVSEEHEGRMKKTSLQERDEEKIQALTRHFESLSVPVDYTKIVTPATRTVSLGEHHDSEVLKTEVARSLETFRGLGFTDFGLEFITQDLQPALSRYQELGQPPDREMLFHHLQTHWNYFPGAPFRYMDTIEEAKRLEMDVHGLDISPERAAENYKHQAGGNRLSDEEYYRLKTEREKALAQPVLDVLDRNTDAKVVTYTGSLHAGAAYYPMRGHIIPKPLSMGAFLREYPYDNAVSVQLVGPGSALWELPAVPNPVREAIKRAGLKDERFMVQLPVRNRMASFCEWVIHTPR